KPSRIVLFGHGEYSIYTIDMELRETYGQSDVEIIPVIGDVQDRKQMFAIVETYRPKIIYHAAAHKHVPLMETNPHEAVKITSSSRQTLPKQRRLTTYIPLFSSQRTKR